MKALRRRTPRKATGLDDRGSPFTFEPEEFEANTREGIVTPWSEKAWIWLGGLLIAYVLIRAVLDPKPIWPLPPGWWIGIIFGTLGGATARFAGASPRHNPIRSATMLAYGYCGACGYTLRELPTDPDGCRKCAECGSAWNTDRFVFADQSKQAAYNRLRGLDGYHFTTVPLTDDRGVLLAQPYRWPDRRAQFTRISTSLARKELAWFHRGQLVKLIAVVWGVWAFSLSVYFITVQQPEEPVMTVIVATLVAAILTLVAFGISLRAAVTRRVILSTGECPSCWSLLVFPSPAPPLAPRFDQCVECPTCSAAWKAADVAKPYLSQLHG